MEVCTHKAVAQLHGRGRHATSPFQHDPHPKVVRVRMAGRQGHVQLSTRSHGPEKTQAADVSQGRALSQQHTVV